MARNKSFSAAGDLQFRKQEVNTEIKKQAEDQTTREYAEIDASLITYSPFNKGLDMDNIDYSYDLFTQFQTMAGMVWTDIRMLFSLVLYNILSEHL